MNETDEQGRIKERERGARARQILDNPLWVEAWAALETSLMEAWKSSQTGQTERRELIYLQLRAMDYVRGYIKDLLETGTMAEMQLNEHERERHHRAD